MPVTPVEVCNGLGAGDAFGGSFCHALLVSVDVMEVTGCRDGAGDNAPVAT